MTTDDFTTAARAEAESAWYNSDLIGEGDPVADLGEHMAVWARDHLAAQGPTDAEVEAAARVIYRDAERRENYYTSAHREAWENVASAALTAARKAR